MQRSINKRNSHMGYMTINGDESYESFLKENNVMLEDTQANLR